MALIKTNKTSVRDSLAFPTIDTFLNDFFNSGVYQGGTKLPAVNISEDEKKYLVELNVPGFKKEDIKVTVKDDVLTVSAENTNEAEEQSKSFSRREFTHTSFSRNFTLPESADQGSLNGVYENGILKIHVPKREAPTSVSREVKIS